MTRPNVIPTLPARAKLWEGHSLQRKADYLHDLAEAFVGRPNAHLDLGCGDGEILRVFCPLTQRRCGVDLDERRLARCRVFGLAVVRADLLQSLPFVESSFDLVTLISVLEHMEEPKQLVEEVWRVLRESGLVVVQIPNPRFIVDLHYFLPFYGLVPSRLRPLYRTIFKGTATGIDYYTSTIGKTDIIHLFSDFDVVLAQNFFYPKDVAPYWARPFYDFFTWSGLARLFPTGFFFVLRKPPALSGRDTAGDIRDLHERDSVSALKMG
jgi:SAM-dependent methyltransferase